jgi:hypothetical protein
MTFAVVLHLGTKVRTYDVHFGAFGRQEQAERFATFLTDQVDPAEVCQMTRGMELRSPLDELLAWYENFAKPGCEG